MFETERPLAYSSRTYRTSCWSYDALVQYLSPEELLSGAVIVEAGEAWGRERGD